ncbi:phosphohistidine phosphatase SixA [Serratia symbiotica]|uniref:phosphohistidine phosphatase SixA n=1 Tax=Serratia symbiotica TaxID=138074 RepID=UPI0030CC71B9|nr:phosphohistidine phosphatase SixA [Serratia symbiotica]
MQVFIMRHGEAVLDAASDAVRPLTLCGRDESRLMAAWLNTKSVDIERVLVSPYLRVKQTLAMVREAMSLPEEEVLPELAPNGNTEYVGSYLQTLAMQGVKCVLIVSHLPLVGYLVAKLCTGESPPMFVTASIANAELAGNGHGKFKWQMSPSQVIAKV